MPTESPLSDKNAYSGNCFRNKQNWNIGKRKILRKICTSNPKKVVVLLPFFTSIQEFEVIRMTRHGEKSTKVNARARARVMHDTAR